MAGFVMAPSRKVQAVMPNWAKASMTVSSFIPRRAARADALRSASCSRRCRRAASSANSTMTKNALARMSAVVMIVTIHQLIESPPQ